MPRKSDKRAALDAMELEILSSMCEDSSDGDSSDDDDALLTYCMISEQRYLFRETVFKVAKWSASRIHGMDATRAKRELRMERTTFFALLMRIREHAIFERASGKQEQAPVQLQFEAFLYTLHGGTKHATAQHFGIGEGMFRMCVIRTPSLT